MNLLWENSRNSLLGENCKVTRVFQVTDLRRYSCIQMWWVVNKKWPQSTYGKCQEIVFSILLCSPHPTYCGWAEFIPKVTKGSGARFQPFWSPAIIAGWKLEPWLHNHWALLHILCCGIVCYMLRSTESFNSSDYLWGRYSNPHSAEEEIDSETQSNLLKLPSNENQNLDWILSVCL